MGEGARKNRNFIKSSFWARPLCDMYRALAIMAGSTAGRAMPERIQDGGGPHAIAAATARAAAARTRNTSNRTRCGEFSGFGDTGFNGRLHTSSQKPPDGSFRLAGGLLPGASMGR